ncbi:hypothetical protein P175DRAFT_0512102 [Aspergillus ochraceoroseus IBT 24754]|uniref:Cytochrome P450 n=2 Tax=Aspergillus ochraceoroseus TaxID=138278 RepID=A0A2T5LNP9_9EURO|nr:uncharacterized protein P175DRAFT_0512102 [Aspergillus ochraceoroseus IBT 24754]KKK14137.1 hypothetical protein AOCH_000825 [Aspergillus ochraceoroseus]PTU17911.1 hypothetical protein P175DRAFT_0512102 [Aspergillus ochraceoroseus IBT 24754]
MVLSVDLLPSDGISTILFTALCTGFVGLLIHIEWTARQNPLSSLPGPWISKYTEGLLTFYWLTARRTTYVDSLHKQYGPLVRISPTEVDVADVNAVREIHKVGGRYWKSEWYRRVVPVGVENIFSSVDPQIHAVHRRLLSAPIAEANLKQFEPIIDERIQLTIRKIKDELHTRGAADVFKWFNFMSTDIVGELTFGESFRMLEYGKKNQYFLDIQNTASMHPIRTTFPFLMRWNQYFPIPFIRSAAAASRRLAVYAEQSIQRYKNMISLNPTNPKQTLFTKLFDAGEDGLTDSEIRYNAHAYIVAGSDTTAVTLTYLVYAVLKHEHVKQKLLAELRELPVDPTDKDLRDLPYLNRVIQETLRVYSVVPSALPRVVPPEGATLAGHSLPGGTVVSTQAYTFHRDPTIWSNPDEFDPDRWINPTKDMKDSFLPWGAGSRICIGMHLARIELKKGAALFFRNFPTARLTTKEGFSDQDMDPVIFFLMSPKGHRLLIEA